MLGEEDDLPAYLVQVSGEGVKHFLIHHFKLCIDGLPLDQDLLGAGAQRCECRAELAVLDPLPLMLIEAEHEQREVILREIHSKLLQVLDQEVLELLEAYRALAVQVNETEGVDRVVVLAALVDEALLMDLDLVLELSIVLQNVVDLQELERVDLLGDFLELLNGQVGLFVVGLLTLFAYATGVGLTEVGIRYLEA